MEIVFNPIKSLTSVKHCHNLVELTLIETSTASIQGLEVVGHSLEILRIINGGLKSFEKSFLQLINLRELVLGSNQISRIENLNNCVHLNKLFLYQNKITSLTGLEF